jgi:polyphenol oxidase
MATLSRLIVKPSYSTATFPDTSSPCPFSTKPTQISLLHQKSSRTCRISCKISGESDSLKVDRRNVLLGLGSLYTATSALIPSQNANASPIATPNISTCGPADLPAGAVQTSCCPPGSTVAPIDFKPPSPSTPLRIRPAAHAVTPEYIAKFTEAIQKMKALPASDPRNFTQQANIHCAYCDGAYDQLGFPDMELQVHNSWLFFPFHRCYLYFFERILGSLINDPTFGIPFWNWDSPDGMKMPAIYMNKSSPLYDPKRDARHVSGKMIDLDFSGSDHVSTDKQMIDHNLKIMYRQVYAKEILHIGGILLSLVLDYLSMFAVDVKHICQVICQSLVLFDQCLHITRHYSPA